MEMYWAMTKDKKGSVKAEGKFDLGARCRDLY